MQLIGWPEDLNLDRFAIDFAEDPTSDDELEDFLIAEGEEDDELDEDGWPLAPTSPDKGLATRLRRGAIILGGGKPLFKTRETKGWQKRGRDFAGTQPTFKGQGGLNHHTAGAPPSAGNAPSLRTVVHGRSDLPGPLAQGLQAYDDTIIVVAAGVANHAGSGGWKGLHHNFQVYGLEVEHPGLTMVRPRREVVMAAFMACCFWRPNGPDIPAAMACQHREWDLPKNGGDGSKIDFAKNFSTAKDAARFRRMIAANLVKLNAVSQWTVDYATGKRDDQGHFIRKTDALTRDPAAWVKNHPGAMQRSVVRIRPNR